MSVILNPIVLPSALKYWLSDSFETRLGFHSIDELEKISLPDNYRLNLDEDYIHMIAREMNLKPPVSFMVRSAEKRRKKEYADFHVYGNVPDKSFIKLESGILISSPEFCVLQAANIYSFPRLIEIINNLCAIYIADDAEVYGQKRREPITNIDKLWRYFEKIKNVRGTDKAKTAVRYSVDCVNSPIEAKLAVVGCLPMAYGGYGLPKPKMNKEIIPPKNLMDFLHGNKIICDFVWEEKMVAAEYDSNLTHLSKEQHAKDKRRTTVLSQMGYKIISISAENIISSKEMDETFKTIRSMLGLRNRQEAFDKYRPIRCDIIKELFRN